MKIYTKTGDDGTTGLFGGSRVAKDDTRVAAYGAVDETNAAIGMARSLGPHPEVDRLLGLIQRDLFTLGAELATLPANLERLTARGERLTAEHAEVLERAIDRYQGELEPLRRFILPGGTPLAAALHLARVTCRRAERDTITLHRSSQVAPELLIYLNRLSDLLFVLARFANHTSGVSDVIWDPSEPQG